MSQHPDLGNQVHTRRRDPGFTLPEMLISVAISGILVVAIAMAFTTVLQTEASATSRLAESKDITFVQTWLPVDLSSAIASYDQADDASLAAALVTPVSVGPPPMLVNHDFVPDLHHQSDHRYDHQRQGYRRGGKQGQPIDSRRGQSAAQTPGVYFRWWLLGLSVWFHVRRGRGRWR